MHKYPMWTQRMGIENMIDIDLRRIKFKLFKGINGDQFWVISGYD